MKYIIIKDIKLDADKIFDSKSYNGNGMYRVVDGKFYYIINVYNLSVTQCHYGPLTDPIFEEEEDKQKSEDSIEEIPQKYTVDSIISEDLFLKTIAVLADKEKVINLI